MKKQSKSKKSFSLETLLVGLGIFFGAIIGITATILLIQKPVTERPRTYTQKEVQQTEPKKDSVNAIPEKIINLNPTFYLENKAIVYKNNPLNYEFIYITDLKEPNLCDRDYFILTEAYTIEVVNLNFFDEKYLLTEDLNCSASGPFGRTYCESQRISPIINDNGATGYLLERTKILELWDYNENGKRISTSVEKYDDRAYIFNLKNNDKYGFVMLYAAFPSQENLASLDRIADSFKITN